MNVKRISAIAVAGATLMLGGITANAALPQSVGGEPLPSLAPMIKQAAPAVVNIKVTATVNSPMLNRFNDPLWQQFFGRRQFQPQQRQAAGSGVIVDARNGYIITNHHVVDGADEITITLYDDREMEASIVGSDPASDVALIQVNGDNLSQIPLTDSDQLEVGDFVVAIGNPFGFSNTVTSGIVSGLGRYGLNNDSYENFIQTDAAINPGNSGGALLNLRGELIGINTAIISRSGGNVGIGFAIPINMARSVMSQILEFGEVRRGLLGVQIRTTAILDDEMREELKLGKRSGAIVERISPDSAAEKAGIQIADIILSVNGEKTRDPQELRNTIGLLSAGAEAEIELLRDGKVRKVTATLGSTATQAAARLDASSDGSLHPGLEGASFANLSRDAAKKVDGGVEVVEVEARSPASNYDLAEGDVIVTVNRRRIANLAEFREAASNGASRLMLTVVREGASHLVFIG